MTEAFDTIRAELVRQLDQIDEDIMSLRSQRDARAAYLSGLDEARRLLTEAATDHVPERPAEPAPQPERKRKYTRRNPERATAVDPEPKPPEAHTDAVDGAGSSSEAAPAERGGGPATSLSRTPGDTGTLGRAEDAGGSPAPDARVLSSAEFVDQSNALRAALEAAGPDGIVAEKAMVAPEVIEEACIAGWCQKGHDPFRHEPWLYWMPEAVPQADATQ